MDKKSTQSPSKGQLPLIPDAPLVSFTWFKKGITWWRFPDRVIRESLPSGELLHSLFASLLSLAISSKMQFKICYREVFNRCNIHRMDKILPRIWYIWGICNRCAADFGHPRQEMSSCVRFFFNHMDETNGAWNAYCISRTWLNWTGIVKRGLVKRGLVKRGLVKRRLGQRIGKSNSALIVLIWTNISHPKNFKYYSTFGRARCHARDFYL